MAGEQLALAYATPYGPRPPYLEPRQPGFLPDIFGGLVRVTPPSGTVLSLADLKLHLRIDTTDDDTYLTQLIGEVTELAECEINGHRQFLTATYNLPLRGWWAGVLDVPRPPLQAVNSISYYDTTGTLQIWASTNYLVTTPWRAPGTLEIAPNVIPPAVQYQRRYPIVIQFTAGYGLAANVPLAIVRAVKLIAGHQYRYRGDDDETGRTSSLDLPPAALNLLRSVEWGSYR
jgi:uncharacterized phiE125 gp8 family phage protein